MNILVTGGAGYIGSHVVKHLGETNAHNITVVDNLSTGFKDSVLYGDLIVQDLENVPEIDKIFRSGNFDAVLHFAASIEVEESVRKPLKYYRNNTVNAINLINLCLDYKVKYFIFSSTAAVYGNPEHVPVKEDNTKDPINPYGMSKLMVERILEDAGRSADGFRYCILRYFNVAGADSGMRIGQRTPDATHLIKVACQAALGLRKEISIFGTDYDTTDGTGVRDYIHVDDLADAHLEALEHIISYGSDIFNCGYNNGYSVRDVINSVKKVSGTDFKVLEADRRPGDSAILIADNKKILEKTGWEPRYNNLEYICRTAYEWEKKLVTQIK